MCSTKWWSVDGDMSVVQLSEGDESDDGDDGGNAKVRGALPTAT